MGTGEAVLFADFESEAPERCLVRNGVACVFSRRRPGRETANEDGALLVSVADDLTVLAVADGLGGHADGHLAAQAALYEIAESLISAGAKSFDDLRPAIIDGFERANSAILSGLSGAATTLVVVEIHGRKVRPYHVGDSALLVCGRGGKLKHKTVAHSPVGYALEAGVLEEHEALRHQDLHLVSNVVGAPDMRIEVGAPLELRANDSVLLMTDGVADNLTTDEIVELIRRGAPAAAAATLASAAAERMAGSAELDDRGLPPPSKPDDLTFILYRPVRSPRR